MDLSALAWTIGGVMLAAFGLAPHAGKPPACASPRVHDASTPAQVRAFFTTRHQTVVTFLGYSGAEYEDPAALVRHATAILDRLDPKRTIVNIGATRDGVGALYDPAKKKGFATSGIVSSQARDGPAALARPTTCSSSMMRGGAVLAGMKAAGAGVGRDGGVSDRLVAFGGGEVTRDGCSAPGSLETGGVHPGRQAMPSPWRRRRRRVSPRRPTSAVLRTPCSEDAARQPRSTLSQRRRRCGREARCRNQEAARLTRQRRRRQPRTTPIHESRPKAGWRSIASTALPGSS